MKSKLLILNINNKYYTYEFFNNETSKARIDETIKIILDNLNFIKDDYKYDPIRYIIKEVNASISWHMLSVPFNCNLN